MSVKPEQSIPKEDSDLNNHEEEKNSIHSEKCNSNVDLKIVDNPKTELHEHEEIKDYIVICMGNVNETDKNFRQTEKKCRDREKTIPEIFIKRNQLASDVWAQFADKDYRYPSHGPAQQHTYPGQDYQAQQHTYPGQDQDQGARNTRRYQDSGGYRGYGSEGSGRGNFIKLVFTVLFGMLVFTSAYMLAVFNMASLFNFYSQSSTVMVIVSGVAVMAVSLMAGCSGCFRVMPCSIVLIVLAVAAMSNFASMISVHYEVHILSLAFIATAGTVFVCLLLACSGFDFTKWYLYVVVIGIVLALLAIGFMVCSFFLKMNMKPFHIALVVLFTLMNIVMLVMELQMVLGGKSIELSEDDWAFAAYMLYMTIMELFMNLVRLLGLLDEDE